MTSSALLIWSVVTGCSIVAAPMSAGVAVVAWRRRATVTAAPALSLLMADAAVWCLTDVVVAVASRGWLPPIWARVALSAYLTQIPVVTATFWIVTRSLADQRWRPTRRTLALLSVHGFVMLGGAAASPWSTVLLRWDGIDAALGSAAWTPGPLFWAHTAYSYLLLSWSVISLIRAVRHGGPLLRRQAGMLLAGMAVPLVASLITTLVLTVRGPNLTGPAFAATGLITAYALLRNGLLDLVPVARGLVLEHLADAVFVLDAEDRLIDVNQAGRDLLQAIAPQLTGPLIGIRATEVLGADLRKTVLEAEHRLELPGGCLVLNPRVEDLVDARGRLLGRVVVARDITELAQMRDRLAESSIRDELTGLFNRRHLLAEVNDRLAACQRDGTALAVLMLDVDHFKSVNDEHGHPVGDALLAGLGAAIRAALGPGDVAARVGGEEFVVLLSGIGAEVALERAEDLRRICSGVFVASSHGPVRRTASLGVAVLDGAHDDPRAEPTAAELLGEADEALYAAKLAGRDRVVLAGQRGGGTSSGAVPGGVPGGVPGAQAGNVVPSQLGSGSCVRRGGSPG